MNMTHFILAGGIWGLLGGAISPASAEPLAENYTIGDLRLVPPAQWQKDTGVAVSQSERGDPVLLESQGQGSLSARPMAQFVLAPKTTTDVEVGNVTGELAIQIEWFDAKGAFLRATPLATVRGLPLELREEDISSHVPEDLQPAQFGLKFWLGEGAKCEIAKGVVKAPIGFKAKGVTLLESYHPGVPVEVGKGLDLRELSTCWAARLEPDTPVASFLLAEKTAYDPKGIVLANILTLNSGASISIHVLCWDAAGTFLREIKLIEGVTEAGNYEATFAMFKDQVPPDTDRISFKIWLGGAEPQACLEGIYYGTL